MATATRLQLKRGVFLTDGSKLIEIKHVRRNGEVEIEDVATEVVETVKTVDLIAGRWSMVEAAPFDAEAWERERDEQRAKQEARVAKRG